MLVGKKYSGFWEGGQGTRDKVRMNRKGELGTSPKAYWSNADDCQIRASINVEVEALSVVREIW